MADHEKVFVICENLCMEEGMTKKQIEDGFVGAEALEEALEDYQPKVLSGTSNPSSSLGNDGDVYFQYE